MRCWCSSLRVQQPALVGAKWELFMHIFRHKNNKTKKARNRYCCSCCWQKEPMAGPASDPADAPKELNSLVPYTFRHASEHPPVLLRWLQR